MSVSARTNHKTANTSGDKVQSHPEPSACPSARRSLECAERDLPRQQLSWIQSQHPCRRAGEPAGSHREGLALQCGHGVGGGAEEHRWAIGSPAPLGEMQGCIVGHGIRPGVRDHTGRTCCPQSPWVQSLGVSRWSPAPLAPGSLKTAGSTAFPAHTHHWP